MILLAEYKTIYLKKNICKVRNYIFFFQQSFYLGCLIHCRINSHYTNCFISIEPLPNSFACGFNCFWIKKNIKGLWHWINVWKSKKYFLIFVHRITKYPRWEGASKDLPAQAFVGNRTYMKISTTLLNCILKVFRNGDFTMSQRRLFQ